MRPVRSPCEPEQANWETESTEASHGQTTLWRELLVLTVELGFKVESVPSDEAEVGHDAADEKGKERKIGNSKSPAVAFGVHDRELTSDESNDNSQIQSSCTESCRPARYSCRQLPRISYSHITRDDNRLGERHLDRSQQCHLNNILGVHLGRVDLRLRLDLVVASDSTETLCAAEKDVLS